MNILLKVTLLTLLSTLFTLLIFDYQNTSYQLDLSKDKYCLKLSQNNYICSHCFKVPSSQFKQKLTFQSQNRFMILSLKNNFNNIFTCQELLQAIDYQSQIGKKFQQKNQFQLKFQSFFFEWLIRQQLNNMKIQFSEPTKQTQKKTKTIQNIEQYQSYATFYYSKQEINPQIKIFYKNYKNVDLSYQIIQIFSIASFISLIYYLHCVSSQKKISLCNKYDQHLLTIIGVLVSFFWNLLGQPLYTQFIYGIYLKIIVLSIVLAKVFGTAQILFLSLNFLIEFIITILFGQNNNYHLIYQTVIFFTIAIRFFADSMSEYFKSQKQTNKKIYLTGVLFVIMMLTYLNYLVKDSQFNQICNFLIMYLSHFLIIMAVKRMNGDNYSKVVEQQTNQRSSARLASNSI